MKLIFIGLLIFFYSNYTLHENHVSIVDINYNQNENSLEIINSIFYDDIEIAISRFTNNDKFDISDNSTSNVQAIKDYFFENFKIYNTNLKIKWIGYELKKDKLNVYIKIPLNTKTDIGIKIKNTIMFDLYKDQKHIVHFKCKGNITSSILDSSKNTIQLSLCSKN